MAGAKNKLRARCRKSKIDEKTKSLPKGPLVILALEVVSSRSILEVSETTEKLASTKLIPTFPRRQRSHRKIKPKNMTVPDTHQQEGSEILKPLCGGKRKCKHNGKETIEPEVVRPSFGRERPKRRIRDNEINPQLGKLDTSAFHCYFEELWKSLPDGKKNSFAYLDCMWFNLYLKPDQQAKVLKWIKKKHIFTKKYVFVPIIRWDHWSLLIICNMGESSQSVTSSPCMLLLDSLGKANSKRLEPEIRRFLVDVYKSEERPENKKQIYKIPLMTPTVPQQKNGEDCGSFVLYYIKLFMESAPESFSISESYPYFMTKDWFTQESLADFVGRLKEEGNVIEENLFNENLKKRGINRNQVHVSDYSSTEIPFENLEYPPKKRVKNKTKKGKKSSEDHIIHITADDHSHDNIDLISHINCNEGVVLHQENRVKENKPVSSEKENKLSDDLNFEIIHISIEDDSQDIDLFNEINFEVDDVRPPFCSCTGFPKQCYKWGNGGWQSSCCTTTLSMYPLPFSPNNKRHRRIVGRKMSGTVFKRLVNQLVKEGIDLSVPLDLKNYWAIHGSNRYSPSSNS